MAARSLSDPEPSLFAPVVSRSQQPRSRPILACLICGKGSLQRFLSLGEIPPVNSFHSERDATLPERRYPLDVDRCPSCSHVQLGLLLEPEDVFTDYAYFSGYADTIVKYGHSLAQSYAARGLLAADRLVAELASNDGAILHSFLPQARVLGIDPARNIAKVANARGVPTLPEFFQPSLLPALLQNHGRPHLILARNVLAHVPDPVAFVRCAADWLAPQGILHVEVPYIAPMLDTLAFDTIYHEHLSYFSVRVAAELFRRAGLVLFDVEVIDLHGGSLLLRGGLPGAHAATGTVEQLLHAEHVAGLHTAAPYAAFTERVQQLRHELPAFLADLRRRGARIAAYGAAAKGVVLTNYCGIGRDLIDFVADRSPHKQGCLMPGVGLPIVAPEEVLRQQPDYLLVLAWNFFAEIARQLAAYSQAGGRFILPIPQPHILAGSGAHPTACPS